MKISETKILHLPILVEQDEDNFYIVSCPVFKGCHSYGKTIDEALVNIKEVIDMCIEEEKEKVFFTLDAVIHEIKNRRTYAAKV